MFIKRNKKKPLLQLWTTWYLATLCIGLIIIGIISSFWLKHNAAEKRLDIMKLIAEDVADRIVSNSGNIHLMPTLSGILDRRQRFLNLEEKPIVLIVNQNGVIIYSTTNKFPLELLEGISLGNNQSVEKLTNINGDKLYLVKQVIDYNEEILGWVLVILPEKDITNNKEQFQLLIIMLVSLGILGWGVIYLLTRKLTKPIKEVAEAAQQIINGNYDIHIEKDIKEKEVYELTQSFKEMAERLQQLEAVRTELLAGVTHELKTPVTSIKGLIQAVKDNVVTGDEAKEFLEICTKESQRLQMMVEDLLDFNSFAVGEINVKLEEQNINSLVQEIVHQWFITQEDNSITLNTHLPDKQLFAATDAVRVQQILYNILNNAKQAVSGQGKIDVFLYKNDNEIRIDIQDNGIGIPEDEQDLIFERFFRGKSKKHKVRGLGLGLSFSKIVAKALGGDLLLKESSKQGTTFTLILNKEKSLLN